MSAPVLSAPGRNPGPPSALWPTLGSTLGLALLATGCSTVATGDPVPVEHVAPLAEPPASPAVVYTADRSLSPINRDISQRLRDVIGAGHGRVDVVAKIGDSMTVAREYLGCFTNPKYVHLAGRDELRPTIEWFSAPAGGGAPSWSRRSLAATKGWPAFRALSGQPSAIDRELAAIEPAFATVMFGTNDIGFAHIDRYGRNLLDITDLLLARGVVPILSSIPPRGDDRAADAWVPRYNAVARAVAQARQVPFIDLHRELVAVRGHGLTGDRVHLDSRLTGCTFTATGLRHGNNRRNLLTLQMLDRLRRTVVEDEPAPDPDAATLAGAGTPDDPYVITSLPFGDGRDTRAVTTRAIDRYTCGRRASPDESGAEVYYRLELRTPSKLRAYLIDRHGVDHDLHLLANRPDAASCIARGDLALGAQLAPGTYYLVVDTFAEHAGEYVLAISDR